MALWHSALPVWIYLQIVDCLLFSHSQFSRRSQRATPFSSPLYGSPALCVQFTARGLIRPSVFVLKVTGFLVIVIVNTKQFMAEHQDRFIGLLFYVTSWTRSEIGCFVWTLNFSQSQRNMVDTVVNQWNMQILQEIVGWNKQFKCAELIKLIALVIKTNS